MKAIQKFFSLDSSNVFGADGLRDAEVILHLCKIYPELCWLSGSVNSTPEGRIDNENEQSLSKLFFGELHPEFDRTAVGCLCIKWVLFGEYEKFVECQKPEVKLTLKNFQHLAQLTKEILYNQEMIKILVVFTIMNDLGKIKSLEKEFGNDTFDHDEILLKALKKKPEKFPSFKKLSSSSQSIILEGMETKFNLAQFIQGENLAGSLTGLKRVSLSTLKIYFLHAFYDTAGAAGHVKNNGSLVMVDDTCKDFETAISLLLKKESISEVDIYQQYLEFRGRAQNLKPSRPIERAAIRLCCMLRIHNSKDAKTVLEVLTNFPEKEFLCQELNCNGTSDLGILLYYSPAMLLNIQSAMSKDNLSEEALRIGFQTLTRLYQLIRQYQNVKEISQGVLTIDISSVATEAKNPKELANLHFVFDPIGKTNGKIKIC